MLDRAARYYGDDLVSEDREPGRVGRVLRTVARNPGRTLAAALLIAGTAAIVVNAAFRQTADHPSPLFATRTAETEPTRTATVVPEVTVAPTPVANPERVDGVARLVETALADTPQIGATPASPDVVEAQQLLAQLGYEPGTVDGLFGSRTRRAIESFQTAQGLTVTGEVSTALLGQLRAAAATPARAATPPAPIAGDPTSPTTILAVQTALNQSGYGPVLATGSVDAATTAAIRRFQLDNGLSVTGTLDAGLIARMTAIGALTL